MKLCQTFGLTRISEMNEKQDHSKPPRWSLRLLRLLVRKDYLEEIEGDMEEVFFDDLEIFSPRKARRRYSLGAMKLLRPAITRSLFRNQQLNYLSMLQHNLLITLRGFKRHKSTFLINLIGLSTGLAASLLIFLWVQDERAVDTFHEKNDQLYWVQTHFDLPAGTVTWEYTSGKLGAAMVEEFPEVEASVRVGNGYFIPAGVIEHNQAYYEIQGLFASPNFFELLSYDLLSGNPATVLQDKKSVVLSERFATRIYGSVEGAIGQTLNWKNQLFQEEFTVSGVFKAPPANATLQFEAVIQYQVLIDADPWADEWNGGYAENYLVLKDGTDIEQFNEKIAGFMNSKIQNDRFTLFIQKYADRYLYGNYEDGQLTGGRVDSVRLFSVVAILILVIACINFMNLSTAQASKKMKEIGVKKAIGANRKTLIAQFMTEAFFIALLSLVFAVVMVLLFLPQFNVITGKGIVLNLREHLDILLLVTLSTGFLAGSYPAFYLSGFSAINVLKGSLHKLSGEGFVRKGLVVVQFSLSIIFIVGVMVINRQIEFVQHRNLGYDRQQVVTFKSHGLEASQLASFLRELNNTPGVTASGHMAGEFLWGEDSGSGYRWDDDPESRKYLFKSPKLGYGAIETLGLEIIDGRAFAPEFNDHDDRIILNEAAVEMMGLENPAGSIIRYGEDGTKEVIGVVKDFQYGSMHQKIEPMVIRFREFGSECLVKLEEGAEPATLEKLAELYREFHPEYTFNPSFLDDAYLKLYASEQKESTLSNYMAGIAIIISCLGLFGLAAFTAERRTKEIGIRKILGASQLVIMRLLTGSFTKTVLVSMIIALPLGYLVATNWLRHFAYSITLSWWIFAIAGLSALAIAWVTVGFQTFKAASVNPVNCLRDE